MPPLPPCLLGSLLQVLQVAVQADGEAAHPHDLVAAWLAALAWVADSRWRRLPAGPHQAALLEWLEALDLRVVALRLAQPEDFGADSPGGAGRRVRAARCGVEHPPRPAACGRWLSSLPGCNANCHAVAPPCRQPQPPAERSC